MNENRWLLRIIFLETVAGMNSFFAIDFSLSEMLHPYITTVFLKDKFHNTINKILSHAKAVHAGSDADFVS